MRELFEQGLIQHAYGPWSFPPVLVPKKEGGFRLCIDYRPLNAITRPDQYPMHHVQDILANLGRAKWFTTFDLSKGYMQVEMDPLNKEKTAFVTHNGKWQFVRMPFGLRNAPATFQRLMDNVLEEANWKWAMAYLDDIVIFSTTIEEHIDHVRDVLQRITQAGLTLHPTKHQICTTTFHFLGHVISPGGCNPDPKKIESVKEFPRPQNITDIQRFMGLAGCYRAFIPRFFEVGKPLFGLLKKGDAVGLGHISTSGL